MRSPKLAGPLALLVLAGLVISSNSFVVVVVFAVVGLLVRIATVRSWRSGLMSIWPLLLFASLLALLGWIGGHPSAMLALKTIGSIALIVSAVSLIPWTRATALIGRHPMVTEAALTGLFIRHFVLVLGREAQRLMVAHHMAAPNRWSHGWFCSLGWALASLFGRAMARAERFYVTQLVRGIGE